MFANFVRLICGQSPSTYENPFIEEVRVAQKVPRSRRLEKLIWIGWVLIALKSVIVIWAIAHWGIPIHPLWVIAPTLMMGALVTLVYWRR